MTTSQDGPVDGSGVREGSGSGLGIEQLKERMREIVSAEITCDILDQTPMIFGTVKEGILEILDERLGAFCIELMAMLEARTLTFREFRACGAPDYLRARDPIASGR